MVEKNSRIIETNDNERAAKRIKLEEDNSSDANGSFSLSKTFLTKTGKVRRAIRTPQERCLELLQDPRIGAAQPHQVFCRMCGNWVKLFNHTEYVAANWIAHAKRCKAKTNWDLKVKAEPDSTFDLSVVAAPDSSATLVEKVSDVTTISVKEEYVKEEVIEVQTKSTAKSLERRQLALDDERVAQAEPHRILCKMCSSWVRLHPAREYDLWNWHKHVIACEKKKLPPEDSYEVDTKRKRKSRTMTERIQAFQDDPYCGEVRPNEAFCSLCQRWIRLHKDVPYVDSNWHRHVNKCKTKPGDSSSSKKVVKPEPEVVLTSEILEPKVKPQRHSGKTNEERWQELQVDTRISVIEPYRVQCKFCNKWIRLQPQRQYDAWNWKKHISTCELRHSIKVEKNDDIIDLTQSMTANSSSIVTLPKPPPVNIHAWRIFDTATEDERRQHLLSDLRCTDVEPNRVTCLICNRSIGLHAKKTYSLSNWYKHITSCENTQKLKTPALDESDLSDEELVYPDFESSSTLVEDSDLAQGLSKRPKLLDEGVAITDVKENMSGVDIPDISTKRGTRRSTLENSHGQQDTQPQPDIVILDGPPALTARQKRTKEKADAREIKLRRDDRLLKIEPDKVFCKMCSKWIKLQHRLPYDSSNWLAHAKKCEIKTGWPSKKKDNVDVGNSTAVQMKLEPEVIDLTVSSDPRVKSEEQMEQLPLEIPIITGQPVKLLTLCDTCHKLIESSAESQHLINCRRAVTSSSEKASSSDIDSRREAELRADPRAATVERGRVFCRLCSTWIRLQQVHSFLPGNWLRHISGCERRYKQALGSKHVPEQPQATYIGEPLPELELENEDETTHSSPIHLGAFGSIELGELIDGYQPCFSSMDIQTKSPLKNVPRQPPPLKRTASERKPTRRSPRKLPNAGSFIVDGIKKEEIIMDEELALKDTNATVENTVIQPLEILPLGESRPYSYKNYVSEPKNITIPFTFKPVEWSRSEEDEEDDESRPGSSASNRTSVSSTDSRSEKKSLNKKTNPPLTSPFTRTVLTRDLTRPLIPIPYIPTTLSKPPYIGKFNTHLVPVNLAYGPMALGARVMRN